MTLYIGVDLHPHQQTAAWCDVVEAFFPSWALIGSTIENKMSKREARRFIVRLYQRFAALLLSKIVAALPNHRSEVFLEGDR